MLKDIRLNPVIEGLVYELRDPNTDEMLFDHYVQKVSEYIALEIALDLPREERKIKTLLDEYATHTVLEEDPVLVTILRAGVAMNNGMKKVFPYSDVGFIGAMRDEDTAIAKVAYTTTPDITDKYVILSDIMIATGGSIIESLEKLLPHDPAKIIVSGIISAQPGIDRILNKYPDVDLYSAAIDPILDSRSYIVPGLGDAGDRLYGNKKEKRL